jgi:hypothetical protein
LDAIRFSVGVFGASIDALSDPAVALASVAADVAFFAFFAFFAARRRARASSVSVSRAASRFRAFPSLARVVVVVVDIAIGIRARLVSPRARRRRRRSTPASIDAHAVDRANLTASIDGRDANLDRGSHIDVALDRSNIAIEHRVAARGLARDGRRAKTRRAVVMARVPLSDAENLAVGAFGGIVETCVQSACDDRGEATARDAR